MSRICELTGSRRVKRNKIAIERSKITRRTKGFAQINLQKRRFETKEFGNITLKISNRTNRTIEKYGGLHNFLVSVKRKGLTEFAQKMRRKIYVKPELVKSA